MKAVNDELKSKGFSDKSVGIITDLISFSGDFKKSIKLLRKTFEKSTTGLEGISDLEFIFSSIENLGIKSCNLSFDLGLARGIDYYTGVIFEVSAPETVTIGSIAGGGRYDNLTERFGLSNMSGIGVSFGLENWMKKREYS